MSIDTEGSEYDILKSFDFSRYSIDLLSVEQNRQTEAAIQALLATHGYKRVFAEFSQWDGWYVHSERMTTRRGTNLDRRFGASPVQVTLVEKTNG